MFKYPPPPRRNRRAGLLLLCAWSRGAMDCVDKLVSEVARNEIWREHIRKESAMSDKHLGTQTYRLNVSNLGKNIMAPKPTARQEDGGATVSAKTTEVVDQVMADLEKQTSPRPAERTSVPPTANGEIGWMLGYSKSMFRMRWKKDRGLCDVTRYADQSWRLGRNPFVKTTTTNAS